MKYLDARVGFRESFVTSVLALSVTHGHRRQLSLNPQICVFRKEFKSQRNPKRNKGVNNFFLQIANQPRKFLFLCYVYHFSSSRDRALIVSMEMCMESRMLDTRLNPK